MPLPEETTSKACSWIPKQASSVGRLLALEICHRGEHYIRQQARKLHCRIHHLQRGRTPTRSASNSGRVPSPGTIRHPTSGRATNVSINVQKTTRSSKHSEPFQSIEWRSRQHHTEGITCPATNRSETGHFRVGAVKQISLEFVHDKVPVTL